MIRALTAVILPVFAAQDLATKQLVGDISIDNLLQKTLQASSARHRDLDETTHGKTSRLATPALTAPLSARPGISSSIVPFQLAGVRQHDACKRSCNGARKLQSSTAHQVGRRHASLIATLGGMSAGAEPRPPLGGIAVAEIPIVDASGQSVDLIQRAAGKRVALYFAAGWCPMCRSFEPALLKFRSDAEAKGVPVECILVSSDRSAADASQRAMSLDMVQVAYEGMFREALKRKFRVWSGSEAAQLGPDRRSGVPALVVLNANGEEIAFVDAERTGADALQEWPTSGQWP
eukprot:gnl/TRDRNA2_/TRDRNA2_75265_c0_seq1.p1 gnl/TRDRNA2_/TRDRNA2_75265_c0~~gnl/TRDRNA2_/TRDRNA2_75265_c0_seq1.p1  ORF type:complete len:291 (+),score=42.22 gnl/TRDRNA2_/TRDRNA2_75265_c0_seq1:73-945(+)